MDLFHYILIGTLATWVLLIVLGAFAWLLDNAILAVAVLMAIGISSSFFFVVGKLITHVAGLSQ